MLNRKLRVLEHLEAFERSNIFETIDISQLITAETKRVNIFGILQTIDVLDFVAYEIGVADADGIFETIDIF